MNETFALQPSEKIELRFRRHWVLLLKDAAGTLISLVVPFIILGGLQATGYVPLSGDQRLVLFISALWTLIIVFALAVILTDYYLDLWLVTDRRIVNIDQVGLFDRIVSSWGIERVVEVTVHTENFIQTFLGYGALQIQTAGPTDEYARAEGVPHPERVRQAILSSAGRYDLLEKETEEKDELLHTVSHEAKGYLSKDAAALAAIADGDVGQVPGDVQALATRTLEETRSGVSSMMHILGGANNVPGFSISRAAQAAADAFAASAKQKGLSYNVSIDEVGNSRSDETQVRELAYKALIDNAIRYTPRGSVSISMRKDGEAAVFSVSDTGVGISREDMANLFKDGGHGSHSRDLNAESTGFGLSTAKRIVEAAGGEISVSSEGQGRGAKFVVRLPIS